MKFRKIYMDFCTDCHPMVPCVSFPSRDALDKISLELLSTNELSQLVEITTSKSNKDYVINQTQYTQSTTLTLSNALPQEEFSISNYLHEQELDFELHTVEHLTYFFIGFPSESSRHQFSIDYPKICSHHKLVLHKEFFWTSFQLSHFSTLLRCLQFESRNGTHISKFTQIQQPLLLILWIDQRANDGATSFRVRFYDERREVLKPNIGCLSSVILFAHTTCNEHNAIEYHFATVLTHLLVELKTTPQIRLGAILGDHKLFFGLFHVPAGSSPHRTIYDRTNAQWYYEVSF